MKLSTPISLACGHSTPWSRILNTARSQGCDASDVKSAYCDTCKLPVRIAVVIKPIPAHVFGLNDTPTSVKRRICLPEGDGMDMMVPVLSDLGVND